MAGGSAKGAWCQVRSLIDIVHDSGIAVEKSHLDVGANALDDFEVGPLVGVEARVGGQRGDELLGLGSEAAEGLNYEGHELG